MFISTILYIIIQANATKKIEKNDSNENRYRSVFITLLLVEMDSGKVRACICKNFRFLF